jgi:hypothetical protein
MCGHGLQLPAHSCSVRLMSTTHFQLLRTQGHVLLQRCTSEFWESKYSTALVHPEPRQLLPWHVVEFKHYSYLFASGNSKPGPKSFFLLPIISCVTRHLGSQFNAIFGCQFSRIPSRIHTYSSHLFLYVVNSSVGINAPKFSVFQYCSRIV